MAVQKTLDDRGISRDAYTEVVHVLNKKLKENHIISSLLPLPDRVKKVRFNLNQKVDHLVGEPYHINGEFKKGKRVFDFNNANNLFLNLEILQQAMVNFYGMTTEESSNELVFVIKLDECEILKQKKMERVTITLMNRALNPFLNEMGEIDRSHPSFFSV